MCPETSSPEDEYERIIADAERHDAHKPTWPSWLGLVVVYHLFVGVGLLLAMFLVGSLGGGQATLLLGVFGLVSIVTAFALMRSAIGWWLALIHGALGVVSSVGGMVVTLDAIALDRLPEWTRGLADGWLTGLIVNIAVLGLLIRPSVTAYYGIGRRDSPPKHGDGTHSDAG